MTTNGTDPQLVPGYTVQSYAPSPYAQKGNIAQASALTTTGNGTPGAPNPLPGNVTDILANPGYGDVSPSIVGGTLNASLVPVPASGTAFINPVGHACSVTVSGGTVTEVSLEIGGTSSSGGTGDGTYTVPFGASVTLTYSAAPTWSWTII